MRVVKHWKRLTQELADASSLETLKARMGRGLHYLL